MLRLYCWARPWRSWESARAWAGTRAHETASFNDQPADQGLIRKCDPVQKGCCAFILKRIENACRGRIYMDNISCWFYSWRIIPISDTRKFLPFVLPQCTTWETSTTVSALKSPLDYYCMRTRPQDHSLTHSYGLGHSGGLVLCWSSAMLQSLQRQSAFIFNTASLLKLLNAFSVCIKHFILLPMCFREGGWCCLLCLFKGNKLYEICANCVQRLCCKLIDHALCSDTKKLKWLFFSIYLWK